MVFQKDSQPRIMAATDGTVVRLIAQEIVRDGGRCSLSALKACALALHRS